MEMYKAFEYQYSHSVLTTPLWTRCHYRHFNNNETEVQRLLKRLTIYTQPAVKSQQGPGAELWPHIRPWCWLSPQCYPPSHRRPFSMMCQLGKMHLWKTLMGSRGTLLELFSLGSLSPDQHSSMSPPNLVLSQSSQSWGRALLPSHYVS